MRSLLTCVAVSLCLILAACSQTNTTKKDSTWANEKTGTQYEVLAKKATRQMLNSPEVRSWGAVVPKLKVANVTSPTSNTRDWNLENTIENTIRTSGQANIVRRTSPDFDFVVRSEYQQDNGLWLKLYTLSGDLIGTWNETL